MFDQDPNSNYIALYAEYNTTRLTIKKKCKHRQDHSITQVPDEDLVKKTAVAPADQPSVSVTEVDAAKLKDAATSAKVEAEKLRQSIRDSLSVTSTEGRILLALVWTDRDSRTRFDMFPELLAADCTYGINKEERSVMLFTGIDGNNQTFTHTWAFLPSEGKWVFNWILSQTQHRQGISLAQPSGQDVRLAQASPEPNKQLPLQGQNWKQGKLK